LKKQQLAFKESVKSLDSEMLKDLSDMFKKCKNNYIDFKLPDEYIKHIKETSILGEKFSSEPTSATTLDILYTGEYNGTRILKKESAFDKLFLESKSRHVLLERLDTVAKISTEEINTSNNLCSIANLGCGTCRDVAMIINAVKEKKISVSLVDTDNWALNIAKKIIHRNIQTRVNYYCQSFLNRKFLREHEKEFDYGLLIGVICGTSKGHSVILLSLLRKIFRPKAKLLISCVSEKMEQQDHFITFLLKMLGWVLVYKNINEFTNIVKLSGWEPIKKYQGDKNGFHNLILAENSS